MLTVTFDHIRIFRDCEVTYWIKRLLVNLMAHVRIPTYVQCLKRIFAVPRLDMAELLLKPTHSLILGIIFKILIFLFNLYQDQVGNGIRKVIVSKIPAITW